MRLSVLTLVAASTVVALEEGYRALDFSVYRGNSRKDVLNRDTSDGHFIAKRDKRDGLVNMVLTNMQTFYLTNLLIGSDGQKNGVLVDTGSSDLWIMNSNINCESSTGSQRRSFEESFEDLDDAALSKMNLDDEVVSRGFSGSILRTRGRSGIRDVLFDPAPGSRRFEDKVAREEETKPSSTESEGSTEVKDFASAVASFASQFGGSSPTGSGTGSLGGGGSGTGSGVNSCVQYGSFSTSSSDSFKRNSSASAFNIQYADNTHANGIWGTDLIKIGDTTVNSLSFALVNDTTSDVGVLGIGLPGLETTYSRSGGGSYQYENLPLKMRNQGLIHKNAYSLYLGNTNSVSGSILFGALDHAKYSGQLTTVPIINTQASLGYNSAIRLEIVVDSITIQSTGTNATITSNLYAALLDTGSTLSYFPSALLTKFATSIGATYNSRYQAYVMACPSSNNKYSVALNFSGKVITVPMSSLFLPIDSANSQCYLGVLEQSGSYILFGDNVLRSAYVVYDLDDLEISLAQVNYTNDTDIEVISSSVPSAVKAVSYSATALSSGSESSATGSIVNIGNNGKKSGSSKIGASLAMIMIGFGVVLTSF